MWKDDFIYSIISWRAELRLMNRSYLGINFSSVQRIFWQCSHSMTIQLSVSGTGCPVREKLSPRIWHWAGVWGERLGYHRPGPSQLWNSISWEAHNCSNSSSRVLVKLFLHCVILGAHGRRERCLFTVLLAIVTAGDERSNICIQEIRTAYPLSGGYPKCQTNLFCVKIFIPTI